MNPTEYFKTELGWLKHEVFRKFLEDCLQSFPPYFWEKPSSSSGKYHSKWSNQVGGLALHSRAVAQVAHQLADAYMLTDEEHDAVVVAAVMHDSVKYSLAGGKHTSKTHEAEGALFFKRCVKAYCPDLPLQDSIYKAIASHQGIWCVSATPKKFPEDFDKIGQLLHIADMVGSRPGIKFDFLEEGNLIG